MADTNLQKYLAFLYCVEHGSFTAVVGASGSGKSTLLHMLGGVDRPTDGNIYIEDTDISTLTLEQLAIFRRRKIGLVYQFYNLIPNLTALENVEIASQLCKEPMDPSEVLEEVGLKDRMGNFPAQLSGGEQQRVSIARALAKKPDFLFLDEPTGALDEKTGRQILAYIADIHQRCGVTMILVTHNQNIAEMADTVIRMNSGRIETEQKNQTKKTAYEIAW